MPQDGLVLGRYRLQPGRQLLYDDVPVTIGVKPLKILSALVEAAGELVTKDELIERIWSGVVVEDNALQAHVSAIRKVLGENGSWIVTVPGYGYRYDGPLDTKDGPRPGRALPDRGPTPPVATPDTRPPSPRRVRAAGIAVGALALIVVGGGFAVRRWEERPPSTERADRYLVLPFANRTGDLKYENLADELSDDTASRIAATAWDTVVVAHNESFAFKGRTVDETKLGRDFDLDYIVEGSIQQTDGRFGVSTTLIDAKTGTRISTGQAEHEVSDAGMAPQWLATAIATHVLTSVLSDKRRRAAQMGSDDGSVHSLLDRARIVLQSERIAGGWTGALKLIDKALVLDPNNAHALYLAGTARTDLVNYYGFHSDEERSALIATAQRALDAAVQAEPNKTLIHLSRGLLDDAQGRHDTARAEFQRALELNPTNAFALCDLATEEVYAGHPEDALPFLNKARPVGADMMYYVYSTQALIELNLGHDAAALDAIRHGIAVDPTDAWAYIYLTGLLQLSGQTAEVPQALAHLLELAPGVTIAKLRRQDENTDLRYRRHQERIYAALQDAGLAGGDKDSALQSAQ